MARLPTFSISACSRTRRAGTSSGLGFSRCVSCSTRSPISLVAAADHVAERAITLGHAPDGRAAWIAKLSSLPIIEPGGLRDVVASAAFDAILDAVVDRVHTAMEAFETDLVTLHLFTGILAMIEKYAWMLRAQSDA